MKTIHNLVQGTKDWHFHRQSHFNASEAAAVMGLSKYQTRSELLREKVTGISQEIDAGTQRRFDDGHRYEAMIRPFAETIIGEELFTATASLEVEGLHLSASFDGHTMADDITWEHKSLNQELSETLPAGVIPDQYKPQMEQQLLIMGAEKCLFMASNGSSESAVYAWYESDPVLRKALIAAWKQFAVDLANYQHSETKAEAVAEPIADLPAITFTQTGLVIRSNIDLFKAEVMRRVEAAKAVPENDQDFANCELRNKAFKKGEEYVIGLKSQILAGLTDIDAFCRELEHMGDLMRTARLAGEKLVTARKETIRNEIQQKAITTFNDYVATINKRLGKVQLPQIRPDFAGVMKGKKTIKSLQDAVDTELARVKIEASETADAMTINLNALELLAPDHIFLFTDLQQIVSKANDDFALLVNARVDAHKRAEAARIEAEVQRRQEEERQAVTNQQRVEQSATATAAPVIAPAVAVVPAASSNRPAVMPTTQSIARQRPTDDAIIRLLADTYRVHSSVVITWLLEIDLQSQSERLQEAG